MLASAEDIDPGFQIEHLVVASDGSMPSMPLTCDAMTNVMRKSDGFRLTGHRTDPMICLLQRTPEKLILDKNS